MITETPITQLPDGLRISDDTLPYAETCWRCVTLGLPPFGIPSGEQHMVFETENKKSRCCMDCFARLHEECEDKP